MAGFDDFLDKDDFYQSFMSFQIDSNERHFSVGLLVKLLNLDDHKVDDHGDRAEVAHGDRAEIAHMNRRQNKSGYRAHEEALKQGVRNTNFGS